MGSTENPENGQAVGRLCYVAAITYIAVGAFCGCQVTDSLCDRSPQSYSFRSADGTPLPTAKGRNSALLTHTSCPGGEASVSTLCS